MWDKTAGDTETPAGMPKYHMRQMLKQVSHDTGEGEQTHSFYANICIANPSAETALRPLIWCFRGPSAQESEECAFHTQTHAHTHTDSVIDAHTNTGSAFPVLGGAQTRAHSGEIIYY